MKTELASASWGGSCNAEERTLLYVTHRGATCDTCIGDMRVNEKYMNGVIYN